MNSTHKTPQISGDFHHIYVQITTTVVVPTDDPSLWLGNAEVHHHGGWEADEGRTEGCLLLTRHPYPSTFL